MHVCMYLFLYTVYIYYAYINTHTWMYIFQKHVMYIYL